MFEEQLRGLEDKMRLMQEAAGFADGKKIEKELRSLRDKHTRITEMFYADVL